jgi:hypothetical protein
MFRTTAVLVIVGAIGFAVLRHQVAAEVPDLATPSAAEHEPPAQLETDDHRPEEE